MALPFALRGESLFAQGPPIAHTSLGTLRGELAEGVRIFRGVPFAQPPLGPLRFRPPVKAQPWKGAREANEFAAAAMQPLRADFTTSEDCLYLNIWAPERDGSYPVFVYIHGGGFTAGRSSDPGLDGASFARNGILCITVAYRLGVFGFLDLGPLLGAQYAGSANNAMRDLICALEWVQANIGAFGGDAARVTIGGESAGAKLTDLLMGVPSAQPLFHQMISESGGAERIWSHADSDRVAKGFGELWASRPSAQSLATAPPAALIEAQQIFISQWPQHFPLRAEIDGTLIAHPPIEAIAQGSTRGKRLLIGTNRDESSLFVGPHPSHDAVAADLGNMSLSQFAGIYSHYERLYPDLTIEQRRIRALTAEEYWIPSVRVAEAHVQGGGAAWMYRLDFAETSGRLKGYAYHSLDNGLVWDYPHKDVENASDEAALATQMHLAWASFIKGDPPSAPGLPTWPQYSHANRATMILNTKSTVEEHPQEEELRLWDGAL